MITHRETGRARPMQTPMHQQPARSRAAAQPRIKRTLILSSDDLYAQRMKAVAISGVGTYAPPAPAGGGANGLPPCSRIDSALLPVRRAPRSTTFMSKTSRSGLRALGGGADDGLAAAPRADAAPREDSLPMASRDESRID